MKKASLVTLVAGLMALNSAFAADVDSCINAVKDSCPGMKAFSNVMGSADSCKMVIASGVKNITFFGNNNYRVTSVDTKQCKISDYTFQSGDVTDNKVFDGRLFMSLSSKRVAMVARDNGIYELRNAEGQPYESVEAIGVDQASGSVILYRDGNQKTYLSMDQIQDRIYGGKIVPLAESYKQ